MNFYVSSLSKYVTDAWDQAMVAENGGHEVRFIVESMPHAEAIAFFQEMEEHRQQCLQDGLVYECHFRLANGLWKEWQIATSKPDLVNMMKIAGGVGDEGELRWVDEEDRLTWYRSRTKPADKAGLVVILVGLSHTTDQGGLRDFHLVDEHRVWHAMDRSFQPWLKDLAAMRGLDDDDNKLAPTNTTITELFKVRPRRLARFASFVETEIVADTSLDTWDEILTKLLSRLPTFDIPAISAADISPRDVGKYLRHAEEFIAHSTFKSPTERSRALKRLQTAVEKGELTPPDVFAGGAPYANVDDFLDTVRGFIDKGNASARARLLHTNIAPVLKVLRKKELKEGKGGEPKVRRLAGASVEVFLRATWETFNEFERLHPGLALSDYLKSIQIKITKFGHDIASGSADDNQAEASQILRGVLGGVEDLLAGVDIRLPQDDDEMQRPCSSWSINIPLQIECANASFQYSRSRPHISFSVEIAARDAGDGITRHFQWTFDANHAERVRYLSAQSVLDAWIKQWPTAAEAARVLPAFRISAESLAALYYSADEEEANRLMCQALTDLEVIDLVEGVSPTQFSATLFSGVQTLTNAYRTYLTCLVADGYFTANAKYYPKVQRAYLDLADLCLNSSVPGATDLLRRFYKAFLALDPSAHATAEYVRSSAVWGISPAVMELTYAKDKFLCDSFPEVIADKVRGNDAKAALERLLGLVNIQRPLAGIVMDEARNISAQLKSFNLIHHLGVRPPPEKSLAVQTLLREQEVEGGDDEVADLTREQEESSVVTMVLRHYAELLPYAEDGLRILAVHVEDLAVILSGLDKFLDLALERSPADWPAYRCELVVYSTSTSPLVIERRLAAWREDVLSRNRDDKRALDLTVAHHFAPNEDSIVKRLTAERRLYDIAFMFHFLSADLAGEAVPTQPIDFDPSPHTVNSFPITEHPRPTQMVDATVRRSLLGNHRLLIQTRHGNMSAQLRNHFNSNTHYMLYGRVNYEPWRPVVDALHARSQWVACIDRFVDKRLVVEHREDKPRKIVGFASGLGSFGELNLSVSSQQDTLTELAQKVRNDLQGLLETATAGNFEQMAHTVIREAEEVIGLSSLRAAVGQGEKIREVIGFAVIRELLSNRPGAVMTQLLPIDSFPHWFKGAKVNRRPDLLRFTLIVRDDLPPLIHADVIECKFALESLAHAENAMEQARDGLNHLSKLFAPSVGEDAGLGFDRRYWWAQLQRAITSRSVVNLSANDLQKLEKALQLLTDGYYEIRWQAAAFTFWTNQAAPSLQHESLAIEPGAVTAPYKVPAGFALQRFTLGHVGIVSVLSGVKLEADIDQLSTPITLCCKIGGAGDITAEEGVQQENAPISDAVNSLANQVHAAIEALAAGSSESLEGAAGADLPFEDTSEPATKSGGHNAAGSSNFDAIPGSLPESPAADAPIVGATSTQVASPSMNAVAAETVITATTAKEPVAPPQKMPTQKPEVMAAPPVTPKSSADAISGYAAVPEKLLLGKRKNGIPVYWHYGHPKLNNRHMVIFGASGNGKTYGIQCLLAELALGGLRSIIIDYTDGFLPAQTEPSFRSLAHPENHFVRQNKLPLNPFQPQMITLDDSIPPSPERPYEVATRVASIFTSVFSSMGDQQAAALIRAIHEGLSQSAKFEMQDLLAGLQEMESTNATSLATKIEPLVQADLFAADGKISWRDLLTTGEHLVHILQLKGLARDLQKLVTEFALWNLYDYATSNGHKSRPIPLVLDEIQNLDHRPDSAMDKMLREGRKFGLSLILATQTTSQFDQEAKDRLFQAGHKLFFKPADTEVNKFAEILTNIEPDISKQDWASRLTALTMGECWSIGPSVTSSGALKNEVNLIKITSLDERQGGVRE